MKRLIRTFLSFILAVLFVSGCSPFRVYTDYDHEVDFSRYQTFKMLKSHKERNKFGALDNQLNRTRIRRAVISALEEKGYRMIEKGRADFLVATYISLQKKIDVTTYGYHGWRYPGPRYKEVHRYKEGAIIIDIIDSREKQLIWRGIAEDALRYEDNPEEDVKDAVEMVMKDFPPEK